MNLIYFQVSYSVPLVGSIGWPVGLCLFHYHAIFITMAWEFILKSDDSFVLP